MGPRLSNRFWARLLFFLFLLGFFFFFLLPVDNPAPAAILPSVIGVVLDGVVEVLELFFGFDIFGLSFVEDDVARSSCRWWR